MKITLPHTIESPGGEKIIFKEIVREPDGDKVIIEGRLKPRSGPPMHVHFKQDEGFIIKSGKAGYEVWNKDKQFASEGETVIFEKGVPHKFWNAGDSDLIVMSWVKPADNIIFYLSAIYAAQQKSGSAKPEAFDAAYLMVKYKNEYDLPGLPLFVKRIVIPLTYQLGRILGKYKKFRDAPAPL